MARKAAEKKAAPERKTFKKDGRSITTGLASEQNTLRCKGWKEEPKKANASTGSSGSASTGSAVAKKDEQN